MAKPRSPDIGDLTSPESNSSNPNRKTPHTSVMSISVTSHETTETITTYVNGRPLNREEVTKIYVIEPVECRRVLPKERADEQIKERRWLADLWLGIWAGWAVYLVWQWLN